MTDFRPPRRPEQCVGPRLPTPAEAASPRGVTGWWLAASGRAGRSAASVPWEIGLRHPRRTASGWRVVRLHDRALGTSAAQFQSFRHRGRRYGHILDPRSGWPAEGVLSTTVAAPTAALADALSTAFYVMGPEPSLAYCRTHPEIGPVMVCPAGRVGTWRHSRPGSIRAIGDLQTRHAWQRLPEAAGIAANPHVLGVICRTVPTPVVVRLP